MAKVNFTHTNTLNAILSPKNVRLGFKDLDLISAWDIFNI
jgi:hypothetical protein